MRLIKINFKSIAIALLSTILASCGGGNCPPNGSSTPNLTLKISAPIEYPAGVDVTAYLTMTNTSSINGNNLLYTVPNNTNNTGVTITPHPNGAGQNCENIAAGASCTFTATIPAGSHPGSFTVTATPNSSSAIVTKLKQLFQSDSISVTANLGLVNLPDTQNSFYILPPQQSVPEGNGSSVAYISVYNQNFSGDFNNLHWYDESGTIINNVTLIGTQLTEVGQVNTYSVTIPNGKSSQKVQLSTGNDSCPINTIDNNINACSNIANVNIVDKNAGILVIQPNYFNLSESYESQLVTLTNTGNGNISDLTLPNIASPLAISANSCSNNLSSGASCQFTINYTPSGESASAQFAVSYNNSINSASTNFTVNYSYIPPTVILPTVIFAADGQINTLSNNKLTSINNGNTLVVSVASNGNTMIAGAYNGVLERSTDAGVTWSEIATNSGWQNSFYVTYGNNKFVAVGAGNILISSDGITWEKESANTDANLMGVAYGNNKFVAVGMLGQIITSLDGVNWTVQNSLPLDNYSNEVSLGNNPNAIVYGNGNFVILAYDYTQGAPVMYYSADGLNWTPQTPVGANQYQSIAYGNGQFVMGTNINNYGGVITSNNGISWTQQSVPTTATFFTTAYGDSRFITAGTGSNIATSSDGVTWTISPYTRPDQGQFYASGFSNGKFFLFPTSTSGGMDGVISSSDGMGWTQVWTAPTKYIAAAYGLNLYVAVGGSTIATSNNASNWSIQTSSISGSLSGITFGNNKFVAVGNNPNDNNSAIILSSTNGTNWSAPATIANNTNLQLNGAAFGESTYIAVGQNTSSGNGLILYSTDAINWTPVETTSSTNLINATFGNGIFVAVGSNGTGVIQTSTDGINWNNQAISSPYPLNSVAYGNGTYVAVGGLGTMMGMPILGQIVMTSTDGITWTTRVNDNSSLYGLNSVTFSKVSNQFIAVGYNGQIFTSTDGTSWNSSIPTMNAVSLNFVI